MASSTQLLNLRVSVPLRGYGFEMAISTAEDEGDRDVSVPLRGYGFEIIMCIDGFIAF